MAKAKSKLNKASSEVIAEKILQENPEGLPTIKFEDIPIVKEMPRMETIIFRNDRDRGMPLEFHYHSKTHRLHHYKLFPGKQYTLPVEVIEHLESRAIPIYDFRLNEDRLPVIYIKTYKHQFSCKTVRDRAA